jgi:FkbM family methyltransferase
MVIQWYLGESTQRELNGEKRIIELIAPASCTFIDVGANVGDWTGQFLDSGGGEKCGLLIEPSHTAMVRLQERFQEHRGIRLVQAAASDAPGETIFHEEADAGETSSLVQSHSRPGAPGVKVRVTTVDEEAAKAGFAEVDMLKIDAEGYDMHVLRGATRLLSGGCVGVVQFEYNSPWANAGSTLGAAIALLESYGFRVFLLRSTGLHPFNYGYYGEFYRCSNFIAVSPRKMPLLESLIGTMI